MISRRDLKAVHICKELMKLFPHLQACMHFDHAHE
jgi:hypothetical protein